ncbi:amidohydrolase [Sinanaerobacter chloroacetimidivorans]|uniref:Amidohydrolase n=1 Tax=Sinanaerobacter chloroacetimidivorans TaxID=2818044 RepID=A0A8J7VY91_9FIRM|nr:amidohydrolase [Sinanaerobacter chloroacetimidivorans]MBR0597302.1 amidohydrolase [Sinanaerobacter chloroacetimidivorans]
MNDMYNCNETMTDTISGKADSVLTNGRVYTINAANSIAEAVAIKDGAIVFVGNDSEAKQYIGKNTKTINLEGKTVLPGFIDTHVHAPGTAYTVLYNIDLNNLTTVEAVMSTIEAFVRKNPDKEIYYGRGFLASIFEGMEGLLGPKKERLDKICPDKPIILTDFGGHIFWLNTKAFELCGITKDTPNPTGGVVEKDPVTGELWGTLKDDAKKLFPDQTFTLEEKVEAVKFLQKKLHSLGYTSIFALRPGGATYPKTILEAFQSLEEKNELKLRVNGARDIYPDQDVRPQLEELKDLREKYHSELLNVTTAKYFNDGVIEGLTGYLLEPYGSAAGKGDAYYGEPVWDLEKMKKALKETLDEGFQIHVHSIGDGATRNTIDAIEYAQKNSGSNNYRNVITHLQLVAPEDIERMARLNIIANVQAYWHFKDPLFWHDSDYALLGERAEREFPLKSFIDAGITVTASADHPVTPEPNPFYAIKAGVTRNLITAAKYGIEDIKDQDDPQWLLDKNERASVLDMVKAYTINGAYGLYMEDKVGSIEKGKCADLIIIDKDLFEINPMDIETVKVLTTIFNGEIVYEMK